MPDETTQEQKKVAKAVKVFCKLPHGIRYTLRNGKNVRLVGMYGDVRSPLQVAGLAGRDSVAGHGVTLVDGDEWEEIVKAHGKSAAHQNGFVFAAKDDRSGEAQAKEGEAQKTGFEPYDPTAHPEDKSTDGTAKAAQQ